MSELYCYASGSGDGFRGLVRYLPKPVSRIPISTIDFDRLCQTADFIGEYYAVGDTEEGYQFNVRSLPGFENLAISALGWADVHGPSGERNLVRALERKTHRRDLKVIIS